MDPLGHDMHLDHDALQHMHGAGLDCTPSTLPPLLLRAGGTSQAREEEEDGRRCAMVTGIEAE